MHNLYILKAEVGASRCVLFAVVCILVYELEFNKKNVLHSS